MENKYKMNNEQYCGTKPILESEPINIPNAKKCRANHGLVTAVPCDDMTFGAFKRKPNYKARLKSLQKQQREIEKRNREIEKAILENKYKNDN